MKKTLKKAKKTMAATKSKKAAPPKKPAKSTAKPAAKSKAPEKVEKKPVAKAAPEKKPAPVAAKKTAAPTPAKKEEPKKATPAATKAAPAVTKKDLGDKVVAGTRKPDVKGATAAPKATPAPLKVEPKIIETTQPEFVRPSNVGALFTDDELAVFKGLLETERNKILAKARRAMEEGNIQIDKNDMMDEVDQASAMIEQNLTFRLLDRDRKLLSEIDHAIAKLDTGDYGYCEGTGEPIPKRRLELRPWCRHSVKYKERLERMKKSGRGVVDEDEV